MSLIGTNIMIPVGIMIFATIATIIFNRVMPPRKSPVSRRGTENRRGYQTYRVKPLLTPWESNALAALEGQIDRYLKVCPQVRIADFVDSADFEDRRKIWAKSVDFVIIDRKSGRVVLVIELDDKSHDRSDRVERDAFINTLFSRLSIPVARFKPHQTIDVSGYL